MAMLLAIAAAVIAQTAARKAHMRPKGGAVSAKRAARSAGFATASAKNRLGAQRNHTAAHARKGRAKGPTASRSTRQYGDATWPDARPYDIAILCEDVPFPNDENFFVIRSWPTTGPADYSDYYYTCFDGSDRPDEWTTRPFGPDLAESEEAEYNGYYLYGFRVPTNIVICSLSGTLISGKPTFDSATASELPCQKYIADGNTIPVITIRPAATSAVLVDCRWRAGAAADIEANYNGLKANCGTSTSGFAHFEMTGDLETLSFTDATSMISGYRIYNDDNDDIAIDSGCETFDQTCVTQRNGGSGAMVVQVNQAVIGIVCEEETYGGVLVRMGATAPLVEYELVCDGGEEITAGKPTWKPSVAQEPIFLGDPWYYTFNPLSYPLSICVFTGVTITVEGVKVESNCVNYDTPTLSEDNVFGLTPTLDLVDSSTLRVDCGLTKTTLTATLKYGAVTETAECSAANGYMAVFYQVVAVETFTLTFDPSTTIYRADQEFETTYDSVTFDDGECVPGGTDCVGTFSGQRGALILRIGGYSLGLACDDSPYIMLRFGSPGRFTDYAAECDFDNEVPPWLVPLPPRGGPSLDNARWTNIDGDNTIYYLELPKATQVTLCPLVGGAFENLLSDTGGPVNGCVTFDLATLYTAAVDVTTQEGQTDILIDCSFDTSAPVEVGFSIDNGAISPFECTETNSHLLYQAVADGAAAVTTTSAPISKVLQYGWVDGRPDDRRAERNLLLEDCEVGSTTCTSTGEDEVSLRLIAPGPPGGAAACLPACTAVGGSCAPGGCGADATPVTVSGCGGSAAVSVVCVAEVAGAGGAAGTGEIDPAVLAALANVINALPADSPALTALLQALTEKGYGILANPACTQCIATTGNGFVSLCAPCSAAARQVGQTGKLIQMCNAATPAGQLKCLQDLVCAGYTGTCSMGGAIVTCPQCPAPAAKKESEASKKGLLGLLGLLAIIPVVVLVCCICLCVALIAKRKRSKTQAATGFAPYVVGTHVYGTPECAMVPTICTPGVMSMTCSGFMPIA